MGRFDAFGRRAVRLVGAPRESDPEIIGCGYATAAATLAVVDGADRLGKVCDASAGGVGSGRTKDWYDAGAALSPVQEYTPGGERVEATKGRAARRRDAAGERAAEA